MKRLGSPAVAVLMLLIPLGCDSPPTQSGTPATNDTVAAPTPVPVPSPVSRWTVSKEVNPLDGKAKISVSDSDLIVRCSPKFEGYVVPPLTNLGHQLQTSVDRDQQVRFKIDGGLSLIHISEPT